MSRNERPTRVICVGNVAYDRIYQIDVFPARPQKVRPVAYVEAVGGVAATAALAVRRFGADAMFWARVGDDSEADAIIAALESEGMNTANLRRIENARSAAASIIVDGDGERLIVSNGASALLGAADWLPLDEVRAANAVLCDLRWCEAAAAVLTKAAARGVPSVLDIDVGAQPREVAALLPLTDYAIFSEPALAAMGAGDDLVAGLDAAIARGAGYAGVTRGERGYLWRTAGNHAVRYQSAFRCRIVDTTGAGDVFHAIFAVLIGEGAGHEAAARFAAAAAALNCAGLGGSQALPDRKTVEEFLATGQMRDGE